MSDNFSSEDLMNVSNFVRKKNILTQSTQVREFEKKWSKWLGVKYSVFVNSGSSANYLSILCLKIIYGSKGEIIVQVLHGFQILFQLSEMDLSLFSQT